LKPAPALGLAAAALVGGIVMASIFGGIAYLITGGGNGPLSLAGGFVGLWIAMIGGAWLATRYFGSGSMARDLGLWFKPTDIGWGVLVAIAGIVASAATQYALKPFPHLLGSNTDFIDQQRQSGLGVLVVVCSTMIGAPIVEELFFRGLLLRALARLGLAAVLVQAIVFGLVHYNPLEGSGNVGIVLGVGAFGLVQGFAARIFGRIGPTIIGHALFNSVAVIPLLLR
jgi:membrane protease YdiL (CAAX protease family)